MADIERINELVGNKEFGKACELLEEALKEEPDNIEILKLAGLTYVNLEQWRNACNVFETVVKYSPEDATSTFYLAKSYENLKNLISAKNYYLKVIELRPEYEEAYKSLCLLLIILKENADAIKYADIASSLFPQDYIYDFIKGTALMDSRDFLSALGHLGKAINKAPESPEIINSMGTCYLALGDTNQAIATYKSVLDIDPNNAPAYFNIGSVYQIKQEHKIAIEYFEKAVALDEDDERFLAALAMSEIKIQDYACALKHYKQLSVLCPNKENYKYNMVTCYEALHDYKTAITLLENILYINPAFILPAQKLANLYLKTNQYAKAKDIYEKILLKKKPTAETFHQYAIISSTLCDTDTAEKMLKKVIRINPDIAKAHKDLAIIYLNKRLFDYAEDEFKTALKLAPNDFEILFEYGNYLYSVSQNTEAERYYTEALELEPDNVIALVFMALNKLVLNQLDEAYRYIKKAIELEPEHEYVQFCAGRILYAKGEYEEAKRYLVHSVEQNQDVETMNTLALTYFHLGDYSQALNIFAAINKKSPQSISVMMDIARCYEALGEKDSALVYLDRVVNIFPENEEAQEMIRKLS